MVRVLLLAYAFAPLVAAAATPVDPKVFQSWGGDVQFIAIANSANSPTEQEVVNLNLTIDSRLQVTGYSQENGCQVSGIGLPTPSYAPAGSVDLDVTLTGCSYAKFNRRYLGGSNGNGNVTLRPTEVALDFILKSRDGYNPTDLTYEVKGALRPQALPQPFTPWPGMWWNPAESGTGYNIQAQHGVLVMTVFSYKTTGESEWYLISGPFTGNGKTFTGSLDKFRNGQCIGCAYPGSPVAGGSDGPVAVSFSDETHAVLSLPNGRAVRIVPYVY